MRTLFAGQASLDWMPLIFPHGGVAHPPGPTPEYHRIPLGGAFRGVFVVFVAFVVFGVFGGLCGVVVPWW